MYLNKPLEALDTGNLVLLQNDLSLDFVYFLQEHLLNFGVHRFLECLVCLSVFFFQVDQLLVVMNEIRSVLRVQLYQNHPHFRQSVNLGVYVLKHVVRPKIPVNSH